MRINKLFILIAVNFIGILSITAQNKKTPQDIESYIYPAVDNFLKKKDAEKSSVFEISCDNIKSGKFDLVKITIIPMYEYDVFYLTNTDSIGKPYHSIISYIEKEGKLFYWYDDNAGSILTEKIYNKLLEYNFIKRVDLPSPEWLITLYAPGGQEIKLWHYYFVNGKYNKFKKNYSIWTRIPLKYRRPLWPLLHVFK